ncbi:MAG: hypothetical protein ACJAVN_000370 [Roseivirga sp.]|jgi:hypothetical protein
MDGLTLIFEGTDFESRILKARLADVGIQSLIKSETAAALVSGFGSTDRSKLFVTPEDVETATGIINSAIPAKED